jgi:hypothetical protein
MRRIGDQCAKIDRGDGVLHGPLLERAFGNRDNRPSKHNLSTPLLVDHLDVVELEALCRPSSRSRLIHKRGAPAAAGTHWSMSATASQIG